jgi:hypothetical protein
MDEDAELRAILEESRREYEEKEQLRILIENIERNEEEARQAREEERRKEEIRLAREEAIKQIREEEVRRFREEAIQRVKEEEEERRQILELRRAKEEIRRQEERAIKLKEELDQTKLKESQSLEKQIKEEEEESLEDDDEDSTEDEELKAAIQASLNSHGQEKSRHDYNQRTHQLLNSLDPPAPGRTRQCIELPKDTGRLIVGLRHHHTKKIARQAGGNCNISFLPRNISINFDGQMGDCLLIEADSQEAVEIAETGLLSRVADLFFQDTTVALPPSHSSMNSVKSRSSVNQERLMKKRQNSFQEMRTVEPSPSTLQIIPSPKISQQVSIGESFMTSRTSLRPELRRHVIVDSSNIFIGAKTHAQTLNLSVNLDVEELANLLIRDSTLLGTRVIAGSVPSARSRAWQYWEHAGFRIKICSFEGAEEMVDEFLHAQAMNVVMEKQGDQPGENTLVLCTGDGNDNEGFSNFVNVARNTARMGWRVEIWSWRHCSSRNFVSLVDEYPSCMRLYYLDTFASRIMR